MVFFVAKKKQKYKFRRNRAADSNAIILLWCTIHITTINTIQCPSTCWSLSLCVWSHYLVVAFHLISMLYRVSLTQCLCAMLWTHSKTYIAHGKMPSNKVQIRKICNGLQRKISACVFTYNSWAPSTPFFPFSHSISSSWNANKIR